MREGGSHRASVCITFDDGYADNCQEALPLLVADGIPCTYFVCSQHVKNGLPFPHDLARGRNHAPNTAAEIRWMAANGVEIGSHTRTHADLGRLRDPAAVYDEVVQSRHELEDLLGQPVRYFAFPFGQYANLSPAAFHLARESGYSAACSAYGGYNVPGDDPFHLQRVAADHTMSRLKNWTTIDPRKRNTPRYDYGLGNPHPANAVNKL